MISKLKYLLIYNENKIGFMSFIAETSILYFHVSYIPDVSFSNFIIFYIKSAKKILWWRGWEWWYRWWW